MQIFYFGTDTYIYIILVLNTNVYFGTYRCTFLIYILLILDTNVLFWNIYLHIILIFVLNAIVLFWYRYLHSIPVLNTNVYFGTYRYDARSPYFKYKFGTDTYIYSPFKYKCFILEQILSFSLF